MIRDAIVGRGRASLAWLRHAEPAPQRLTRWSAAGDIVLAVLLTIGAISGAMHAGDGGHTFVTPERLGPIPWPPLPPLPPGVPLPPDLSGSRLHWWELVLAGLTALPLLARRRYPLVSFWIMALAMTRIFQIDGANFMWIVLALLIAAYSALTYSRYRNLAMVSVAVATILIIASGGDNFTNLASGWLVFLVLALIGLGANAVHTWRQRAATRQRDHEVQTRLAVEHERASLARELHDVVGHNVSVMIIQAGAARKMLDLDSEQARTALLAVEASGRSAMSELRQMIGLLTDDGDGAELAPAPGLDQLSELAERIRHTGVPVTLTVSGTFDELPAGVELAAYRVVQEALTNAVKHAVGAAVEITVSGSPDELRVEVTDTGGTAAAPDSGSGRGLIGLRERLAAYGGTLSAGRRATGGFRVLAVTPLRGDV